MADEGIDQEGIRPSDRGREARASRAGAGQVGVRPQAEGRGRPGGSTAAPAAEAAAPAAEAPAPDAAAAPAADAPAAPAAAAQPAAAAAAAPLRRPHCRSRGTAAHPRGARRARRRRDRRARSATAAAAGTASARPTACSRWCRRGDPAGREAAGRQGQRVAAPARRGVPRAARRDGRRCSCSRRSSTRRSASWRTSRFTPNPSKAPVVLPRPSGAAALLPSDGRRRDAPGPRDLRADGAALRRQEPEHPAGPPQVRDHRCSRSSSCSGPCSSIIGSFFRGPGFNFIWPWKTGLFFDL